MQTIDEKLTFPLLPPNVAPAPRRAMSDSVTLLRHPRVSSVNANFEYVLHGKTVRQAVDELFHHVDAVPDVPKLRRTSNYQGSLNQQSRIDKLEARLDALEAAMAGLLDIQMQMQAEKLCCES